MGESSSDLAIRFDLSELNRVSEWLNDIAARFPLPASLAWILEVCAHEAITNIISYSGADADCPIQLHFTLEGGLASLSILDKGQAFNPLEAPPPKPANKLEEAVLGGLGIHLIRNLADECGYQRQNDSNVLVIKIFLPTEAGARAA